MKKSKKQLNAISRSYTKKFREQAIKELSDLGIDYAVYCNMFNYKGSPVRLLQSYYSSEKTIKVNLEKYKKAYT